MSCRQPPFPCAPASVLQKSFEWQRRVHRVQDGSATGLHRASGTPCSSTNTCVSTCAIYLFPLPCELAFDVAYICLLQCRHRLQTVYSVSASVSRNTKYSSHASPDDARLPPPRRLQCGERPRAPHGSTSEAAAVGRARHAGAHECHCHLPLERARLHAQWPDVTQRPLIPRGLVPLPRLQIRDAADHHHCRRVPGSRVDPGSGTSGRLVRLSAALCLPHLTPPPPNIT